jgi:hypothetical protein
MEIIETSFFTKQIARLMTDDEYSELQIELAKYPESGDLIPGGNGLRKLRWGAPGIGKRSGYRVIYYWTDAKNRIYMLMIYAKSTQQNLDKGQITALAKVVAQMKKE